SVTAEELQSMILDVRYHHDFVDRDPTGQPVTTCPVVRCTNADCPVVTHFCKLDEHFLLCQFRKVGPSSSPPRLGPQPLTGFIPSRSHPFLQVPCINRLSGCPFPLLRHRLSTHLTHCPASVVHCSVEWNRW